MSSTTPDRNPWRQLGLLAPTVAPSMAAMFPFYGNQLYAVMEHNWQQSYLH